MGVPKSLDQLDEVTTITDNFLIGVRDPAAGPMKKIKRGNIFVGREEGEKILYDADGYYDVPANYLLEKMIVQPGSDATIAANWVINGMTRNVQPTDIVATKGDVFAVDIYDKSAPVRVFITGLNTGSAIIFLKRLIKA